MSINELNLSITQSSKKSLSIYVHIPFCKSKCNYCAFVSKVASDEEKSKYFNALLEEIKMQAEKYAKNYNVISIYIGGGTPSCLDYYFIRDILSCIYKNFSVLNSAEITIEINPNSIDRTKIREYVLSGVNRFSIGLQSTSVKILSAMGRTHNVSDFEDAVKEIRLQGIHKISADIIIGYPGQKLGDIKDTIKYLVSLEIPHISAYMLSVEDGTKLKRLVEDGEVDLLDEDKVVSMYDYVVDTLEANGYKRYEISNFALPLNESVHNKVYWQRKDYLGIGLASHSYVGGARIANTENFANYYQMIENKQLPIDTLKNLTLDEMKEEAVMLSLRTDDGINLDSYQSEFGESLLVKKKDIICELIKNGYLILTEENKLKCTSAGFLVVNEIIRKLVVE